MKYTYNHQAFLRPEIGLLTEAQLHKIHLAALEILEETGIRFFDNKAVNILSSSGAYVENDNIVKIPSYMVNEALRTFPDKILISNRKGEHALALEGMNVYWGTGTDTPHIIDPYTQKRRKTNKKDVGKAALLCDYLSNIDFVGSMAVSYDVPQKVSDRYQFVEMLKNTVKPILFTAWDKNGLSDIYEMCVAVAGSEENFKKNPFILHYSEPSSPLQHSVEATQKLLFCAEKRIPLIYISAPVSGASAPVTIAGSLLISTAEWLSAAVLHQLKNRGAPLIFGGGNAPLDMKTSMALYSDPTIRLHGIALKKMASYYGIPDFSEGGCSDAKIFDQQAASEATFSLLTAGLAGCNLVHDVGYIESGLTASYEEIIFSNDVIEKVKIFLNGIDISEDSMALSVIKDVGPGGNFLGAEHTMKHFKKSLWYPEFFNRDSYDGWMKKGGKPLGEVLNEKVKWILENHKPELLEKNVLDEIERILKIAEKSNNSQ